MSKINKFVKHPGIFFRDYFLNKYPLSFDEQGHNVINENILITDDFRLYNILENQSSEIIDVVITWVNNNDPSWIKKLNFHKDLNKNHLNQFSIDSSRFENHGELYYVIKSIESYIPWVNSIFLVTDNQIPEFPLSDKVKIIDHKQIINHRYLPTFNSHVIEAHLHNIPDLSENFIYFNDDVFIARKLPKTHFLSGNNLSSLFLNRKNLDQMIKKGVNTPTLSASLNSRNLLLKKYNKKINNPLAHTYVPLKKSYFELAWSLFRNEINGFLPNQFRNENDLNLATFLVPWIMYFEGKSKLSRDICYYFNVRSTTAKTNYTFLSNKFKSLPHSFCANDFSAKNINEKDYKDNLIKFLSRFYI
ncbi:Stealth CR1 domain-containing protein [Gilliamella sp. B2776]|uniref:stealth family protein n=1 Tax=unclassified Gilliamella TaxID=2685620 RepID=UPI00226A738F|nr:MULTISPECIES: stealth family protein [unclassified Gilliamella]MCX8650736.1 Stealth CR1 domain-containing protein [Gilliamella sp. B2779]MCX8654104.1 Stealth CR1 domain-containing protein [Gilliamella sp. B2737]MCX8657155.1 Stealth CR1 domain-containing protein [Gilliamella sp. B2894]MCX8665619.1 Stealth CR1 domain-containing protein [Gilliamella sp. B2887]MCX8692584.1 Stealth CR1 domain-containing protein [Gilliamella sp. B2776]